MRTNSIDRERVNNEQPNNLVTRTKKEAHVRDSSQIVIDLGDSHPGMQPIQTEDTVNTACYC